MWAKWKDGKGDRSGWCIADTEHVLAGRCKVVEKRMACLRHVNEGIQEARAGLGAHDDKALETGKAKVRGKLLEARQAVAYAMGARQETRGVRWQSLRHVIGGALPKIQGAEGRDVDREVVHQVVAGILKAQEAIAVLREGWYTASK